MNELRLYHPRRGKGGETDKHTSLHLGFFVGYQSIFIHASRCVFCVCDKYIDTLIIIVRLVITADVVLRVADVVLIHKKNLLNSKCIVR